MFNNAEMYVAQSYLFTISALGERRHGIPLKIL